MLQSAPIHRLITVEGRDGDGVGKEEPARNEFKKNIVQCRPSTAILLLGHSLASRDSGSLVRMLITKYVTENSIA